MINPLWIRVGALYVPIALAVLAAIWRGRQPKLFAACLLSILWTLPSLIVLQRLNLRFLWWSYADGSVTLCGMPLELYFGWAVFWGLLPQLLFSGLPIAWAALSTIALDLIAMSLCHPVVVLGRAWLWGEATAMLFILVPALALGRWTLENTHLRARAAMQVMIATGLFLYLIPELAFAARPDRAGWTPLLSIASWKRQLGMQFLFLLAIPGLGAVMEFVQRGAGTPIPYDPPRHLVRSGIYRYCANPMQLSTVMVMLGWSVLLRNVWVLFAAIISFAYSAGLAEWDESQELARRFGMEWKQYRSEVKSWLPHWKPCPHGPRARLYTAATCSLCSELRLWLVRRTPVGLEIIDAEKLPPGSIRRMRYQPEDGTAAVDGVRALGRALEHLNLLWAIAGTALRLPLIWQGVQLVMDASGLGPRMVREADGRAADPREGDHCPALTKIN